MLILGTPAEEAISGKVFLLAEGAFRGLDAVLMWHPGPKTQVGIGGGAAMDSVLFRFRGRTAHAATLPHEGRSAADAAVLTEVAVNFLREHIEDNARIHSVITEAGVAPNVVPDEAEIWYYIRGRDRKQVDELRRRVVRCARAAAMATETRCRTTVTDSLTERIPNHALGRALDAILRQCGGPPFTPADVRTARRIAKGTTYSCSVEPPSLQAGRASNDAENVSWFVPLGKFSVACVPEGTVGHTRQYAALARTSGAHRGMVKAAEVLAAAAVEVVLNRALLGEIKAEFRRNRRGKRYDLPMSVSTAALARSAAAFARSAQRPGSA